MRIDLLLDELQNTRFRNKYYDLIKKCLRKTPLNHSELETILMLYYKFVLANGPKAKYMTKHQLTDFLGTFFNIKDLRMAERIFLTINGTDGVYEYVLPQSFLNMYIAYTTDCLEEQMEFCFKVYDIFDQGFISRQGILQFISNTWLIEEEEDTDELAKDMVDLIMKRFDVDVDGKISYEDYVQTVRTNPDLMQFLGLCMPGEKHYRFVFNRAVYREKKN